MIVMFCSVPELLQVKVVLIIYHDAMLRAEVLRRLQNRICTCQID